MSLGTEPSAAAPGQAAEARGGSRCAALASPGCGGGAVFSDEQILARILKLDAAGKLHGVFPDIPASVYNDFRFPGVRSSDLKEIITTNFERWEIGRGKAKKMTEALNFGSAFHAEMAQEPISEFALTAAERATLKMLGLSVKAHPKIAPFRDACEKEYTFFAKCPITGLLLRCRTDLWHRAENIVGDWKTCMDASPKAFSRDAKSYGYKISAAFYMRVVRLVTGTWPEEFRIFAAEKLSPWGIGTYSYLRDDCEDTQADIDVGLARIKAAREGGWKSYDMEPVRLRY